MPYSFHSRALARFRRTSEFQHKSPLCILHMGEGFCRFVLKRFNFVVQTGHGLPSQCR